MEWYAGALAATSALYGLLLAWLWIGVRAVRRDRPDNSSMPSVSIVVAARNEADTIADCLQALQRQQYDGPLQVVIVDDRSTDGMEQVLEKATSAWQGPARLLCVQAPTTPQFHCPKKSALAAGIEASDGDLLLFTDADCRPPPAWVARMVSRCSERVGLVAGFACVDPLTTWRDRLLAVDNLGVSALAAGSIGRGGALSCTGRSLAYRRSVYDQVDGFEAIGHLLSGDDVYFLRHVAEQTDWQIRYCIDADAVVPCVSRPGSWRDTVQQKLRHASKAARYGGAARWLGAGVYAYHTLLAAGLVQLVTGGAATTFLAAWGARWLGDAFVLATFAPRGRADRVLLTFLPVVEVLYLPYVLLFVPLGRAGWFRWRDDASPATPV